MPDLGNKMVKTTRMLGPLNLDQLCLHTRWNLRNFHSAENKQKLKKAREYITVNRQMTALYSGEFVTSEKFCCIRYPYSKANKNSRGSQFVLMSGFFWWMQVKPSNILCYSDSSPFDSLPTQSHTTQKETLLAGLLQQWIVFKTLSKMKPPYLVE